MKPRHILLAVAALTLAACGNEDIIESKARSGKVSMTFTAGTSQTRTQLGDDGHVVNWTEGDLVAIWDGTDKNEFTAADVSGSTATLTGEAAAVSTYTAFYPCAAATDITHRAVTFTLPARQEAVAGSFADGLNPSWAQATGGGTHLTFHNLCALAKLTVGSEGFEGVTAITLKTNTAGAALAGSLTYDITASGLQVASGASCSVTLAGTFEAGATYYFVVAPGTQADGIRLSYTDSNGQSYEKSTATPVTFTAGTVTDLGTLDETSFSCPVITNTALISVIEQVASISLQRDDEGYVPVDSENWDQIKYVTSLDISNKGLQDLSGIEYFTNLIDLNCSENSLTSLDVSGLTNLITLNCNNNSLTSLDVSGLTNLTYLYCYNNSLTSLDVSGLTNLAYLDCGINSLTSLDVSGLTNLTYLFCNDNSLTSLDVSGLTNLITLNCNINSLTSLDVSGLTNLTYLYCNNNSLTSLDVSDLTKLYDLQCFNNRLSKLDVTINTALKILYCGSQTNDNSGILTLFLTADQANLWETSWKYDSANANVYVITVISDGVHDGFTDSGTGPVFE